jgi:beta-aspartyl-peptidase (threonine type)
MGVSLVIHGGAGDIGEPERYAPALRRIVEAGAHMLEQGARALDVVCHCVQALEDEPLFNAGRGSVLNADGMVRCDASIMDGATLAAGAVAGVQGVTNPVVLARLVMEKTPHVFMIGAGAEQLGREYGLAFAGADYFQTPERQAELENARARLTAARDQDGTKHGTVGAVARDRRGDLAAATSTGGLVNQRAGRVGDSPVIGAGVYADNASCAVSCTGVGEDFLRTTLARVAAFQVETQRLSAAEAADAAIEYLVRKVRGSGGLIMVDADGHCGVAYSTRGMLFALHEDGKIRVGDGRKPGRRKE